MADVLSPEQRKRCMSNIKGKNTKPEVTVRKLLWAEGLRYRIGHGLPGKPDIVFVNRKVAIFIDGCFWHKCPIHYSAPKTNAGFWSTKIDRNVQRDHDVEHELKRLGWTVVRFWEHEVKEDAKAVVLKVVKLLELTD